MDTRGQCEVAVVNGEAELAIGTRYSGGGSIGEWSEHRIRFSQWATMAAGLAMKARPSDPMSGFFAIRPDLVLETDLAERMTRCNVLTRLGTR